MMPDLHMRASKWYEQNNHLPDAIRHALDAHEFERAAILLKWRGANESKVSSRCLAAAGEGHTSQLVAPGLYSQCWDADGHPGCR